MNLSEFYAGRRVLVTGGKGFIGTRLCDRLRALGAVVYPFDKRDRGPDVTVYEDVGRTFYTFRPQLVFHLAALTEVGKSHRDPAECYRVNFQGTLNVLEACRLYRLLEHGTVSLVLASSDKAYGEWDRKNLPYTEKEFTKQGYVKDPYSASKRHADLLVREYNAMYGLPVRVARPCNVYGPGQRNETTLITGTVLRLLRGEPAIVHEGAASILREWLYVDDVVEAYLLLPTAEREADGAYNVGSGEVYRVSTVVSMLAVSMLTDGEIPDVKIGGNGPPSQTRDQWLDSTRFRTRFPGWTPVGLAEGLERTVKWYRENYDI